MAGSSPAKGGWGAGISDAFRPVLGRRLRHRSPLITAFAEGPLYNASLLPSSKARVARMKFLWWIVLALAALLLILFAVSNREMVSVGLWPLPVLVEMPLYLVVLGTLILGFVLGELVTW